ncbi:VOC family protein [Streptomyces sp. Je 1-332]|uniref:VOC family protein n=1 Tax=Streptomyces sp. Je 1-332 TaxID=3231270 RepID=UPI00345A7788
MRSTLYNVAFDCADAFELAQFWSKVVGHPLNDDDLPGESTAAIALPTGLHLYFAEVSEPKTQKNRVHLCLRPDSTRDAEVERLLGIGATVAADRRNADGSGWVVFTDPEGNEFCVLRSAAERAAGEAASCDRADAAH